MNKEIRYRYTKKLRGNDLLSLFHSVGWCESTSAETISYAMSKSSHIVTAWCDSQLVGLIRSMDDDCWSANIDCLVVHKDFQNIGVGKELVKELLEMVKHIETISVSPNEKENIGYYVKRGFTLIERGGLLQIYNEADDFEN